MQRRPQAAEFEVIMCPEMLAEIADALTERPRLRKWIDLPVAREYIDTIAILVDLVPDPADVEAATSDSDDDYLVALAREHGVDFIVTGDKDLLEWETQTPPAIPPAARCRCGACRNHRGSEQEDNRSIDRAETVRVVSVAFSTVG